MPPVHIAVADQRLAKIREGEGDTRGVADLPEERQLSS
jgi:hypothetical protein